MTDAPGLLAALTIAKGDGDLYLRKGAKPTTSAYDCRPYDQRRRRAGAGW